MQEPQTTNSLPNSETPSEPSELRFAANEVAYVQAECDLHGPFNAKSLVIIEGMPPVIEDCPKCRATREAKSLQAEQQRAQRHREERLKGLLAVASIPPMYATAAFGNYNAETMAQRRVLVICQQFVKTWPEQLAKGGTLLLTGSPGTGKTHLGCAIGNALIAERRASVAYGNVSDLLLTVKETYRRDSTRTERQAKADLIMPELLIVDELAAQLGTDHEKQLMFDTINGRYNNLRPTILISNLNQDDLETYLGERAMDRFRQCATVLAFDWESYRGRRDA